MHFPVLQNLKEVSCLENDQFRKDLPILQDYYKYCQVSVLRSVSYILLTLILSILII